MKVLLILAHPGKGSFNHAIAQTVRAQLIKDRHAVLFHDLHEEGFNPILENKEIPKRALLDQVTENHCKELKECDGIVIVHPNWWGQPPAILKGWIDRVIRPGVAYEFLEGDKGEGVPVGLLKAKTAIVINTSNTEKVREDSIFKDPLETIWKNCIFDFCGVKNFHRKVFRVVITSTHEERISWLTEVENLISTAFPQTQYINPEKIEIFSN